MVVSILAVVFVDEVADDAVDGLSVLAEAVKETVVHIEAVLRHEGLVGFFVGHQLVFFGDEGAAAFVPAVTVVHAVNGRSGVGGCFGEVEFHWFFPFQYSITFSWKSSSLGQAPYCSQG